MSYYDQLLYQSHKIIGLHSKRAIIIGALHCATVSVKFSIINKYSHLLSTTDLQFGFESKHLTVIIMYFCVDGNSKLFHATKH